MDSCMFLSIVGGVSRGSLTIIKLNDNPEYEISNDRDTVNHAETIKKMK